MNKRATKFISGMMTFSVEKVLQSLPTRHPEPKACETCVEHPVALLDRPIEFGDALTGVSARRETTRSVAPA